ncbi:MAG TPA: hypothetical protein EYH16_02440 [Leucothrix mucor]|nr:hypothetical protein [Leucothrix mucor]
MRKSEDLSLYLASQLSTLLIAHPTFKFIGLRINKEGNKTSLHSIYLEKENVSEELPFRALVTVAEWDGECEEEFFLEALTAERLVEKLQSFDEISSFVFFKIPKSITMDTVNMYPQPMFCKLFPELGEFNQYALASELIPLKAASIALLEKLDTRLKQDHL